MLLPKFDFHCPASLDETCELLGKYKERSKLLAGGTDLLVNMKKKLLNPEHVVSIDRIEELDQFSSDRSGISIGPRFTIASLLDVRGLKKKANVLVQAAEKMASPLIRNRATVGGNIVTARPASDMAAPLMALGARVVLKSRAGEREVLLDEFFLGPGQSVIKPDEVLTRIIVSPLNGAGGSGYQKLGLREAMEIGIVNAAAVLTLDKSGRKIEDAKVVLGAVAPTPIHSPEAEKALVGAAANVKTLAKAAECAVGDSCAITDFRGTIEYRCLMVEVLTRRALETALEQALGN